MDYVITKEMMEEVEAKRKERMLSKFKLAVRCVLSIVEQEGFELKVRGGKVALCHEGYELECTIEGSEEE